MIKSESSPRIYRVHHSGSLCRRRKATRDAMRTQQQSCSPAFYRPVRWKTFVLVVRTGNTWRKLMGEGGVRVGTLIAPLVEELCINNPLLFYARGAPISLHASAALLEGKELVLEDSSAEMNSYTDAKMDIFKNMLKSEQLYCRTLKSVAKLYESPLRKLLSLTEDDHKRLFDWVHPLCIHSNLVCFKLQSALEDWDSSEGKIGNIFSKQLWNYYDSYRVDAKNYTIPLLKEKIRKEEDFSALLILRQGAAEHSLLDFLHLPLERLVQYDEFLSQLLEVTPQHHPDRSEVFKSSLKVKRMVRRDQSRDEETDLDRIQYLFPNENLRLYEQDPLSPRKGLLRSKSAATLKLHRALSGKSKTLSADLQTNTHHDTSPSHKSRFDRCCRAFIMEGPVQFSMGMQSQNRHLFLFNDILLIAKPRPSGTFKLKEKLLVCELWLSDCVEEVCEIPKSTETSFVFGWPTTNVVATFSSFRIKGLWEAKLQQLLQAAHEKEKASATSIQIAFFDQDNEEERRTTVKATSKHTTSDCIHLALRQLSILGVDVKEYQLWARTGKDESPYPLIGHEFPFSIKMNVIRELLQRSELDLRNLGNISTDTKCSFILRRCKGSFSPSPDACKKQRKHRRQTLVNWPFRRQVSKQDSLSEETSKIGSNLFGQPLTKLCKSDRLPTPILGMLTQLFQKGPRTVGIFRKSANARVCRELKERLQSDQNCNVENVPVVVLASVFKEFLRCLPGCLLQAQFYFEWLEVLVADSEWESRERVIRILSKLPHANHQLLKHFLCVLWHISQNSSENKMSSSNLAVCIGPSLLSPPSVLSDRMQSEDASKKVPKLITFLIDHYQNLFGEDCSRVFGSTDSPLSRQDSGAEESDSLREGGGEFQRDDSSIDSLERDLIETSPKLPNKTKVSLTNLSRDSGLTLSDTQLYTAEEELESETSSGGSSHHLQQHYYTKSVSHLETFASDHAKVTIDGSCNDVVRKRKHHSSSSPPSSFDTLKHVEKRYGDTNYGSSPPYATIAYRETSRSRRQRRYEVRSNIEPLRTAESVSNGLRKSSSEESLLRKYVSSPQQKRPALHRKGRAPSPPSVPYESMPGNSSDESTYFASRSPDPQALWFAKHSGTMDWKRSQSTSRIDEIDSPPVRSGSVSEQNNHCSYSQVQDATKSCGDLHIYENCISQNVNQHSYETSWSDNRHVDHYRNPPSYQEAITRQSLLRHLQVTDQMRMEQTNLSAKARQLYEESVRIYNEQTGEETHRAVPVRIEGSLPLLPKSHESPAESIQPRLRHLPPVHVSDEQIVRHSRSPKTKVNASQRAWKDRRGVLDDLRGEICWSVAQLRSLFATPHNDFKMRKPVPPPYRPPPPVTASVAKSGNGYARDSSADSRNSAEESFV